MYRLLPLKDGSQAHQPGLQFLILVPPVLKLVLKLKLKLILQKLKLNQPLVRGLMMRILPLQPLHLQRYLLLLHLMKQFLFDYFNNNRDPNQRKSMSQDTDQVLMLSSLH